MNAGAKWAKLLVAPQCLYVQFTFTIDVQLKYGLLLIVIYYKALCVNKLQ